MGGGKKGGVVMGGDERSIDENQLKDGKSESEFLPKKWGRWGRGQAKRRYCKYGCF